MRPSGSTEIRGSVVVEGWTSVGVHIGVTDARSACEYGSHTEPDTHVIPDSLCSSYKRALGGAENKRYEKDGLNTWYGKVETRNA